MTAAPGRVSTAGLTGVRGLAALAVIYTHAAFWTGRYAEDTTGYIYSRLEVAVPVFFALSAFLLFRPWAAMLRGDRDTPVGRAPALGRYLYRRARRILPAYWLTVVVVYLVYLVREAGPFGRGWEGFVRNMTLTQLYGYGHQHDSLTQNWSLAIEVAFYLALPVIGALTVFGVCRSRRRPRVAAAAIAALIPLSMGWIWLTHQDVFYETTPVDITAQLWLPSFLGWFAAGMLLALAEPLLARAGRVWPPLSLAVAAAAFALACTPLAGEPTIMPRDTGAAIIKSLLYLVITVGVLAPLVMPTRGWYRRLLESRPVMWLGSVSYELFLIHLLVMALVMDLVGYRPFTRSTLGLFELTVLASLPIAWLMHLLTAPRAARAQASSPRSRDSISAR